jgi:nitrate reductase NapE component
MNEQAYSNLMYVTKQRTVRRLQNFISSILTTVWILPVTAYFISYGYGVVGWKLDLLFKPRI